MEQSSVGGAYVRWSDDVRSRYIRFLDYAINKLMYLPAYEGSGIIFEDEVSDLVELCEIFEINIDEVLKEIERGENNFKYLPERKSSLFNIHVFKAVKGKVGKKIREIIEKELRPTDPILEKLEELKLLNK